MCGQLMTWGIEIFMDQEGFLWVEDRQGEMLPIKNANGEHTNGIHEGILDDDAWDWVANEVGLTKRESPWARMRH